MAELKKNAFFRKKSERQVTDTEAPKKTWWVQIRLFPIWLRIIIVIALLALAVAFGVMVGFGVVGDGKPADALKWETWQHIIDIMTGK
ncbi:DNA-directed RNA polymerase subunit beta [Planococcus versutus]|uniref:Hydroxymyristoyl-ACP dehydratase n=1 Tax=Planococcus versutus TaxID=1302659 RepID=A0A1B1S2R0_9BACL|nr:DNA-directed RNA polymerase subunit beta [Planococcus versutus]ANU27487.1 hypothetical protein I858_010850 [Planococcus versutus]